MIYHAYRYLYQSILIVFGRGRKARRSAWDAAFSMPLALLLLFIVLLDALDAFPRTENYLDAAEAILSLYMGLVMVNYFLFIKSGNYRDLIVEFERKSGASKRVSRWLGWLLVGGGCLFPALYLVLAPR